jgi:hypothetical protein
MGTTDTLPPRRGDWMITASGRQFWPLDPRADEVDLWDVATGLAFQGRYNGQGRHFFSIAQHSVELARWFVGRRDLPNARWALLHDAWEAYAGDVIRPIKRDLPEYVAIERRGEPVVWAALGLEGELPAAVKDADSRILGDEMQALFPAEALKRHGLPRLPPLGIEIRALLPSTARDRFLALHRELFGPARAAGEA